MPDGKFSELGVFPLLFRFGATFYLANFHFSGFAFRLFGKSPSGRDSGGGCFLSLGRRQTMRPSC
jgi:hypothetical protein